MRADIHPHQKDRLATLRDLRVLDTDQEAEFDEIVALASRICDAPISLISLVDQDRQWFKGRVGFPEPETDLDVSICSHVILQEDLVEISDTLLDARTADNPLCLTDDPLRFYAGAPLIASNGLPIGSLCVLDKKPRALTDLQRDTLRVLARQVIKQIELKKALRDGEKLKKEMDHRIKNSLQNVSSVVRLFSRQVKDPDAIEALQAIQRRIEAVGALHEQLQISPDTDQVEMASFLKQLTGYLRVSSPENIEIKLTASSVVLASEKASAIGMIVSEFFSNSLKHAFPEGHAGEISISLSIDPDGHAVLVCRDNGIGSAKAGTDHTAIRGLGQELIAAAASQAGGFLEIEQTSQGCSLRLDF